MPEVGAYSLVLAVWKQQKREGNPLNITNDGTQRRDFTYVDDVVSANILAALHEENFHGESFNIGNGDNRSVNQLADMIGGNITRVHRDPVIEPKETLADNGKASFILNWKPTIKIEDWVVTWKEKIGL